MSKNMVGFIETMNIISSLSGDNLDKLMDSKVEFNVSTTISGLMLIVTGLRLYAETEAKDVPDTNMRLINMADDFDNKLYKAVKVAHKQLNKEVD